MRQMNRGSGSGIGRGGTRKHTVYYLPICHSWCRLVTRCAVKDVRVEEARER